MASASRPSLVADAGGILALTGALAGVTPDAAEVLALDWAMMTVGRYLALHHEGRPQLIELEIGLAAAAVSEWFPVRTLVVPTLARAGPGAADALDSWAALVLAEHLTLPLLTASDEVASDRVEVLRPW